MRRIKAYFSTKTPEQVFTLCLLVTISSFMLLCAIARLCGVLWFAADLTAIPLPSKFWQEVIKGALLTFELTLIYKLLIGRPSVMCFSIALAETPIGILLGEFVNNVIISNLYYMACVIAIPALFVRRWYALLDGVILYSMAMLYGIAFSVGRIGGVNAAFAYDFVCNVIGVIDFKLFFVALYLFVKYFGGIRLWKTQKRLIFQNAPSSVK